MSGGDPARTGINPGPGPEGEPEEHWQFEVVGGVDSAPVAAEDVLFVSAYEEQPRRDLGNVFALDAATGEQRWCMTSGTASRPNPIIVNDLVLVGAGDLPWSPPAYGLARGTRFVVALERSTGLERWRFYHGGFGTDVVATNESVYVSTSEGGLWALDPATGEVRWLFQVDADAGFDEVSLGRVAVADGVIYVTGGGLLHAVDAETGEMHWQVGIGDEEYLGLSAVADDTVYVTSSNGVYAVDTGSGAELWRFAAENTRSLGVADGVVYVGTASASEADSEAFLYAIDAGTGQEQWSFETEGFVAMPAIVGDVIYIATTVEASTGTNDGIVLALATEDGQEMWRFPVNGQVTGPTVIGGTVFVGTEINEAGALIAIRGTD